MEPAPLAEIVALDLLQKTSITKLYLGLQSYIQHLVSQYIRVHTDQRLVVHVVKSELSDLSQEEQRRKKIQSTAFWTILILTLNFVR